MRINPTPNIHTVGELKDLTKLPFYGVKLP